METSSHKSDGLIIREIIHAVVLLSSGTIRVGLDKEIFASLSSLGVFYKQYHESLREFGGFNSVIDAVANSDLLIVDLSFSNVISYQAIGAAQALGKTVVTISDYERKLNRGRFSDNIKNIIFDASSDKRMEFIQNALSSVIEEIKLVKDNLPDIEPSKVLWERVDRRVLSRITQSTLNYLNLRMRKRGRLTERLASLGYFYGAFSPSGMSNEVIWLIFYSTMDDFSAFTGQINLDRIIETNLDVDLEGKEVRVFVVSLSNDSDRDRRNLAKRLTSNKIKLSKIALFGKNEIEKLLQTESIFKDIYFSVTSSPAEGRQEVYKVRQELYVLQKEYSDLQKYVTTSLSEAQSREREDVWQNISFTAAHKLGNPLFSIETFVKGLGILLSDNKEPDVIESLDGLLTSINRAQYILSQFTSLTRAQSIECENTKLSSLKKSFKIALANAKVHGSVSLLCSDEAVYLDSHKFVDCIEELISNAKRHTNEKTRKVIIEINIQKNEDERNLVIKVMDNGEGIPDDSKKKIFEPLYSTRDQGTGIGLAVVRATIERHGGKVIEKGKLGDGADFEIIVPIKGERNA